MKKAPGQNADYGLGDGTGWFRLRLSNGWVEGVTAPRVLSVVTDPDFKLKPALFDGEVWHVDDSLLPAHVDGNVTSSRQMPEIVSPPSPGLDVGSVEFTTTTQFLFTVFVTSLKIGTPILTVDYLVSVGRKKPMVTPRLCKKIFQRNGEKKEFSCIVGDAPTNMKISFPPQF
jgi:hypothetical protein